MNAARFGDRPADMISTEALAAMFGVKPQSVRHALCKHGAYLGLRPTKLPNRLLRWDRTAAEAVCRGEYPATDSVAGDGVTR